MKTVTLFGFRQTYQCSAQELTCIEDGSLEKLRKSGSVADLHAAHLTFPTQQGIFGRLVCDWFMYGVEDRRLREMFRKTVIYPNRK